jgi:hypothetical protein
MFDGSNCYLFSLDVKYSTLLTNYYSICEIALPLYPSPLQMANAVCDLLPPAGWCLHDTFMNVCSILALHSPVLDWLVSSEFPNF